MGFVLVILSFSSSQIRFERSLDKSTLLGRVDRIVYNTGMKLPYKIKSGLTSAHKEKWQRQFVANDRAVFESIWRRTQDERNAELSGWQSAGDMRRRMVHFYDRYDVIEQDGTYAFILQAPYLWISLAFPEAEIFAYHDKIRSALFRGGWVRAVGADDAEVYTRGDLNFMMRSPLTYLSDERAGRKFPAHYKLLDIVFSSTCSHIPEDRRSHPWDVLDTGIRTKDTRGNPKIVTSLTEIEQYFPIQVELGCGPSIEVGIPPLHYLHRIYRVSDPETHRFIMSPEKDTLLEELLSDPEGFFMRSSVPYINSIEAEPNDFFLLLKELAEKKLLVGDIITNNFDGLSSLVGLTERYVRQYAEVNIIPHIDFHHGARSLVVIGAHADRRKIQHSARERGLKVIYVDPEGYHENGTFRSYPLESPQDTDIVVPMTASEFAQNFRKTFST